jgi:hypothetical protein
VAPEEERHPEGRHTHLFSFLPLDQDCCTVLDSCPTPASYQQLSTSTALTARASLIHASIGPTLLSRPLHRVQLVLELWEGKSQRVAIVERGRCVCVCVSAVCVCVTVCMFRVCGCVCVSLCVCFVCVCVREGMRVCVFVCV